MTPLSEGMEMLLLVLVAVVLVLGVMAWDLRQIRRCYQVLTWEEQRKLEARWEREREKLAKEREEEEKWLRV